MGAFISKMYHAVFNKTTLGIFTAVAIAIYYWLKSKKNMPFKLPSNAKEITLEFLQKHYSKNIKSFKISPLTAEVREGVEREDGGGISGASLAKIAFESDDTSIPKNAIVKINDIDSLKSDSFIARFLGVMWGIDLNIFNATEVLVFDQARKAYDDARVHIPATYLTLSSHNLQQVPRNNPLLFLLFDFRSSFRTFIIIEDVSTTHKSWPQGVGLDKSKVTAAFENIARLHALNYEKFAEKEELKLLPKTNVWYENVMIGANARNFLNKSMMNIHKDEAINKTLDNWTNETSKEILTKVNLPQICQDQVVKDAMMALRKLCAQDGFYEMCLNQLEPQTLLHGDFHGWNHIFPRDESKDIDKDDVVLVDFQITSYGRIAWELVYFLNFSVDYISFEEDLEYLDKYYSMFESYVDDNPKVKNYTKEMFYREIYLTQVICAIKWLCLATADNVGPKYWIKLYNKDEKGQGGTFAGLRYFNRIILRLKGLYENKMLDINKLK